MTQDGPEVQTWTDFEEDCDAVNQARASKINDSGYSPYQRVFGRNPPQMEDAVLECEGADLGVVSRQQTGELAASLALDQKRRWKRALYHAANHFWGEMHVGQPLWFWRPFHDDYETAHEHVMEYMRDLGDRLLHERRLPIRGHHCMDPSAACTTSLLQNFPFPTSQRPTVKRFFSLEIGLFPDFVSSTSNAFVDGHYNDTMVSSL